MENNQEFLNTRQAAAFCGFTLSYFQKIVAKRKVPFYVPCGRKQLFKVADLRNWIEGGRVSSNDELISKAHASLAGV